MFSRLFFTFSSLFARQYVVFAHCRARQERRLRLYRSAGAGDFACTARQKRATLPVPLGRSGLACRARQERATSPVPLGRSGLACRARQERATSPVPLGRSGGFACTARQERAGFSRVCNQPFSATSLRESDFGGVEPPKSRGTLPKILSRGIFGSVPLRLVPIACLAKGAGFFAGFARLTAPPQSKADFFLTNSRDFGGIEPPKSLGENSCFPLKPFSALWRIAALRAESAASPRVPPAAQTLFLKKKGPRPPKRL